MEQDLYILSSYSSYKQLPERKLQRFYPLLCVSLDMELLVVCLPWYPKVVRHLFENYRTILK